MHNFFQPVNSFYSDKISNERILERAGYLESAYDQWTYLHINNHREDLIHGIKIRRSVLVQVASSYFYDVERLKHFHNIEKVDGYKIAAFTMKWLVKLKPLFFDDTQLDNPEKEITTFHNCCNEIFALKVGMSMARIKISKIPRVTLNKLAYHFTYRDMDEYMLMILLEAIDQ